MNKLVFIFSLILLIGGCSTPSEVEEVFKKGIERGVEKGKKEGYEKCERENFSLRQKAGQELHQLSSALDEVERQKRHYEITELWKALYAPDIAFNNIKNLKFPELSIWHIPFILFFLIMVFGALYIVYKNYQKTAFNELFEEAKKAYERLENEQKDVDILLKNKDELSNLILKNKEEILKQKKEVEDIKNRQNTEKRKVTSLQNEIRSLEQKRNEIKEEIDRFSM